MVRKLAIVVFVGVAVLALAACSSDDEDGDDNGDGAGSTVPVDVASGPGISVTEALASDLDTPLLVNGFLIVTDGEARLCEVLLESYPPQCGGASLTVDGLDLDSIEGLSEEGGVVWTDQQIQLLGEVEDGVLDVALAAA